MNSKIIIYIYSRCNTCKKAVKWLEENKLDFEYIDIINNPPNKELLEKAMIQFKSIKPLLNTSGSSYRNIGASKIKSMDENDLIKALIKDSKLIKRPFLITPNNQIIIGFKIREWSDQLSNIE